MVGYMKLQISIIIILCFSSLSLDAQKLGPYLISTSGHQYNSESISLYASIGEPINTFETDGDVNVSQGVLQSILKTGSEGLQSCESNTGRMFFENCNDGTQFFFIEDQNGKILDPYFGEGVEFEDQDNITVNFGYKPADFNSPCSQAEQAVVLTCVEESTTTSTYDISKSEKLLVYPNPSQGLVTINSTELPQKIKSINIYNNLGMLVWKKSDLKTSNKEVFDIRIGELGSGIYHMQFITEESIFVDQIILQKG